MTILTHYYPGPNAARYLCGPARLTMALQDYGTPDDTKVNCEACRKIIAGESAVFRSSEIACYDDVREDDR